MKKYGSKEEVFFGEAKMTKNGLKKNDILIRGGKFVELKKVTKKNKYIYVTPKKTQYKPGKKKPFKSEIQLLREALIDSKKELKDKDKKFFEKLDEINKMNLSEQKKIIDELAKKVKDYEERKEILKEEIGITDAPKRGRKRGTKIKDIIDLDELQEVIDNMRDDPTGFEEIIREYPNEITMNIQKDYPYIEEINDDLPMIEYKGEISDDLPRIEYKKQVPLIPTPLVPKKKNIEFEKVYRELIKNPEFIENLFPSGIYSNRMKIEEIKDDLPRIEYKPKKNKYEKFDVEIVEPPKRGRKRGKKKSK